MLWPLRDAPAAAVRPLPTLLIAMAVGCFLLAYADPHYYELRAPSEGEAGNPLRIPRRHRHLSSPGLFLSMGEKIEVETASGGHQKITKMDLLKEVTERFVRGNTAERLKGRFNDLIGIHRLCQDSASSCALTLDHSYIIERLRSLRVNHEPRATRQRYWVCHLQGSESHKGDKITTPRKRWLKACQLTKLRIHHRSRHRWLSRDKP